jgi:exopolyphosphatase/guanosine-5'-triphosphate,3'-diphosphate pyrophosphatase
VTTTGDGPLVAGPQTRDGHAAEGEAAPDAGRASLPVSGRPDDARRGKARRNRRRRRGPVYARGAASASPAESQPRPQVSPPRPIGGLETAPAVSLEGPLYAALDLGTNNCRLLIASPRDRGFRVVDAFSRIVRLGEGIGATGQLGEAAMARSIAALRICSAKLSERKVTRARLIATEACRAAGNGLAFVERVQAETGLALEIVSREAEARLAVAGCASLVDPSAAGVILFDIGGGSSELVWICVL